ncbi:ArsR family transcriptional regulator [Methanobrevibacter millerae]|uniref:Regulatory protein, arsR family n=1 Tax=Methanobrevibacter millerae TaxID=230361 RepID=A0A1G5V9W0_9EURY|nr:ArsR family transcriptional regulator [Methanobrevibacter millerae]SDA42629.1 regulatory protein, arsR family [Methanobrevibacter millerae]
MILDEFLGENDRIKILEELLGYTDYFLTVEEISRMADVSQKRVQNHLKQLKDIGILEVENKRFKLNKNDKRVLALGLIETHEFQRRLD